MDATRSRARARALSSALAALFGVSASGCGPTVDPASGDDTDADATATDEGDAATASDADVAVEFIEHRWECHVSCTGQQMLDVLTLELTSPVDATVEIQWIETRYDGRPPLQTWSHPWAPVELPAATAVEVVLRDAMQQCGPPEADEDLPGVFAISIDDIAREVEGISQIRGSSPGECATATMTPSLR